MLRYRLERLDLRVVFEKHAGVEVDDLRFK